MSEGARLTEGIRPEALDERQIEDLIAEHLQQHLEILPEQDLANALHEFVDKVLSTLSPPYHVVSQHVLIIVSALDMALPAILGAWVSACAGSMFWQSCACLLNYMLM